MTNRSRQLIAVSAAILAAMLAFSAQAASKLDKRVADATEVIHEFTSIPESAIPDAAPAGRLKC